jgi:hypothetical protein
MPAVLVGLLLPILPLLAALLLLSLSQTHTSQHGATGIQGFLETAIHNSFVEQLLGKAKQASRYVISHFAGAQLRHLTAWFSALGFLIARSYTNIGDHAKATADAMQRVHGKAQADAKALRKAQARERTLRAEQFHHAELQIGRVGRTVKANEAKTQAHIKHLTHAIDVTLPREIAGVRKREETLSRDQAKLRDRTKSLEDGAVETWDWIKSHPLSATTGVFAGAVSIALARLGFGFLRCNSWRNLGKRMNCGMGSWLGSLLDLVATFALALLAVLNPDVLARVTVRALDVVEPEVQRLLATSSDEGAIEQDVQKLLNWLGL